jgi:DNA replication protein DnaC
MTKKRTQPATPPASAPNHASERLTDHLRELRLPAFRDHFQSQAERAAKENLSYPQYLEALTSRECEARTQGRVRRLLRNSRLVSGKTWDQFQWPRLPRLVQQQLHSLRDGAFLKRCENVLVFGKPGSGKTHALCALGEQLVLQGYPVLFTTCSLLVQELLAAKRDLKLERFLKKLAGFPALIIDDLGYVQQSREEMEGAFHLAGRALRTGQRAVDEQSRVLAMATDLQGPDDDRCGHRPLGASQCDRGTQRPELPPGDRKDDAQTRRRTSRTGGQDLIRIGGEF